MTQLSTRLVRLLNMVPYFQANPRITRAEAAADLGVSAKQLEQDLNQLWMCGLPGYGPGDLIDFEFSGDTIEVTFSAGIDRPLQLTSPEATGLLVALRALADIPGVVDPEAARSSAVRGRSCRISDRDNSGATTENDGFSVVAATSNTTRFSTAESRASCWVLENRCTSSMNSTVRSPERSPCRDLSITARTSLTPADNADSASNRRPVACEINAARVVLPHPGGP